MHEINESQGRLKAALADRYLVEREIGSGGMANVYLAKERLHERRVAIKVMKPEVAAAFGKERFLREIKVIARLNHPHILPLLDSGETDGLLYYVMPHVDGGSLRDWLNLEKQLPIEDALQVAREVAGALSFAHAHEVLHRDVKPENILVSAGHALLGDFGIARALTSAAGERLTGTGLSIGTPEYMSPEQGFGGRELDRRSDLYSLACVVYEMLAGEPPFTGRTAQAILARAATETVPSLRTIRPTTPEPVERALRKALSKVPADRFSSLSEFANALDVPAVEVAAGGNIEAVRDIATSIVRRDCVLFLGLDVPAAGGQGSSSAERVISEKLAAQLDAAAEPGRLAWVAQELEMDHGRSEMLRCLREAIRSQTVWSSELLGHVAQVPFHVIVTTAYDTELEEEFVRAGRKIRRIVDCRRFPEDLADEDLIVQLFGSVERDESIVVTVDDVWGFFARLDSVADELKSVFATHTSLFIGYDPQDEAFRHLFSTIASFRAASTGGCYLVARDVQSRVARWSHRNGLAVVDSDPISFLQELRDTIVAERGVAAGDRNGEDRKLPSRPYKFLNFYEESDERIFFGREVETRRLLSKLHAYPLNLLYAPSGSGKTSLINAALIPQLKRDRYAAVYTRLYDDPEGEIRKGVLDVIKPANDSFDSNVSLDELLPRAAGHAGKPIVIFLDQFEEIFVRYNADYRRHFAASLQKCIASSGGRVRFVISLREDYLACLSEFREQVPAIFHNESRLDPLSEEEARQAIVEPARLFDIEVEQELVDRLVTDLSTEGIEPPQLQIVCDTLYDALDPERKVLTLKSYRTLGETRKILGNYLDRVVRELAPVEQRPAREILKNLVTSEETKTISRAEDLARMVGEPEATVASILNQFSNRRLVRRVQRDDGFCFELTHEYLVDEIATWLTEKDKQLKKIRELLGQAVRNYRHLGILIPSGQVRLIRAHEAELNLNKEELQLLQASKQTERRKQKRRIVLAAMLAVLLAVVIKQSLQQTQERAALETRFRGDIATDRRASYRALVSMVQRFGSVRAGTLTGVVLGHGGPLFGEGPLPGDTLEGVDAVSELDVIEHTYLSFLEDRQAFGAIAYRLEDIAARQPRLSDRATELGRGVRAAFIAAPAIAEDTVLNRRIRIEPVSFQMGSPEDGDERRRRVVLTSAFFMQEHEVTNKEYARFDPDHRFAEVDSLHPVVSVNWYEAMAYAAWLGGTLPTEAQWEFAARGPEGRLYPWGDQPQPDCQRAVYGECGRQQPAPVKSAPLGATPVDSIYDLAGNVWEWISDWHGVYILSDSLDPRGPKVGSTRVVRGGSSYAIADYLRASLRDFYRPRSEGNDRGFRVVFWSVGKQD